MASLVLSAVKRAASLVGEKFVECAASVVVKKFVEKGLSFLSNLMLRDDSEFVAEALRRIETALPQIRAVMGVAEALKMKDPSTREWVQQFRDAVDAADDVLDELEYRKLETMVHNRGDLVGEGSSSSSKKRKTEVISGDILERLKKTVATLDQATDNVERLMQRSKDLGIHYLSESQLEVRTNLMRETTSFLAEREVFGRDAEKALIIGWLKRETEAPISSFGIVGVGGLGKTTLAQSAYKELRRTNYFEETIWICISTEFSVKVITANILAELGDECKGNNPLNVLQQRLENKIHSKKILLILDDVWEDNKRGDWEQLIVPLRCAQQGSKILFTTRQKSVVDLLASVISTEHKSLALEDLKEQELRLLFNSYAYHGFCPNEYGDLQAIGDQIVKKLHGNPLAAKVIGSLLNSCLDSIYWRRISNHESLINLEQANNVMEVLKLSYYNLPADLQVCFRFCSIFPEDHQFCKEDLIKMWMASGFLGQLPWEQKRPENIGEDYFNILFRKSFFEFSKRKKQEYYVMHDLIYELAKNVSEGECCRVGRDDKSISIPNTVQHVSVHESEIHKVSHLENIRSLVITTCENQDEIDPNIFVLPNNLVKKSLRLLKIHANRCCKLQEEVSCLVHLRYLSIDLHRRQVFEYILHSPIYMLYHLLVLEFNGEITQSSYSEIETTGMTNLISLRYMRLPDKIMETICGVHMMTSLQKLTFFVGQESGYRINELHTLNNLRELTIFNVENTKDHAEARGANLLAKENLQSLKLICTSHKTNHHNHEQILENLQPHQNLMELVIENYKGQSSPMWMKGDNQSSFGQMPHLKILKIYDCPNLGKLPDIPFSLIVFNVVNVGLTSLPNLYQRFSVQTSTPLPKKSSLRFVLINKCPNLITLKGFLKQDTVDLHGLKELTIMSCENLTHTATHAFRTSVSLNNLCIKDCPKLTCLPLLPLSLISFKIECIGLSELPEYLESSGLSGGPSPSSFITSSLRNVSIQKCPNLISLNGFLHNMEFGFIETFLVGNCENLVQIPKDGFSKFLSLDVLEIQGCPKLAAVDIYDNLLPSKLTALYMGNCGELDVPLLESSSGLTTLNHLQIQYCANITRIPPTENVFGSLSILRISNCPKLIERSLMPQAQNVDQGSNVATLKIKELHIDQLSLLLIEPLRSLRSVSDLFVSHCWRIDSWSEQWLLKNSNTIKTLNIWDASIMLSLPATMARLQSLERLCIYRADLLVELPDLPASLKVRKIKSSDGADIF